MGQQELWKFNENVKSPAPGREEPLLMIQAGDWLGSSFVEKDLGILEDSKLNVRQQYALAAKTNSIGSCINMTSARTSREVITLLYLIFNRQHLDIVSIF